LRGSGNENGFTTRCSNEKKMMQGQQFYLPSPSIIYSSQET